MIANLRAAIADLPITDRGIDPDTLVTRLDAFQREIDETIAADRTRIANLEAELAEATEREEAIQLMFVAATKAKQQLTEQGEQRARERLEAASAEASRVVNSARSEAVAALNAARSEAEELVASASAEVGRLRKEHAEREAAYRERLAAMKSTASVLETELRTLAATGADGLAGLRKEIEAAVAVPSPVVTDTLTVPSPLPADRVIEVDVATPEPAAPHSREIAAPIVDAPSTTAVAATAQVAPAAEHAAPGEPERAERPGGRIVMPADVDSAQPFEVETQIVVDATERAEAEATGEDGEPRRGSFYTRRSAKLPHIGTENNTMEVVGRMRTSRHRDGATGSNEEETEDLAYQHA